MTDAAMRVRRVLNQRFILDFPREAVRTLERLDALEVANLVEGLAPKALVPMVTQLLPEAAARLLEAMPEALADELLAELPPSGAVRLLGFIGGDARAERLARLDPVIRRDLETMLAYPVDSAGRQMSTSIPVFRADASAGETLERLRGIRMRTARSLFIVDEEQRLTGKVLLSDVALSDPAEPIGALAGPVVAVARPTDPMSGVTEAFEKGNVLDLPVIDLDGILLGAITHEQLARTIQDDATVDLQTMVGASKDERALSSPFFTVKKRMPWLQVNLVTAFMAAAVVGVFENTIAQVTALAVLLPVVAGQSGNTGAQALAVTMRGLALKEITVRQWARVLRKEVLAGFLNGLAIAITCGIGVYVWSQSLGLVAVIMSSMVLAMVAAGFAGAIIPVILTRLGQDPATSSSIILTTVTDIAGFFAFLGIATLMMGML